MVHSAAFNEHSRHTLQPLVQASTLPGSCYTSTSWYEGELDKIFRREWLCVGRQERIPNAGDYFTISIGPEPVVVVRGRDGIVRAFSNVCRHRGCMVVSGAGNGKALVCPYHNWTYGLTGELISTPGRPNPMDDIEGFNREDYGLVELRVDSWGGFVFVNFWKDGPALRSWLGDLPDFLANYKFEEMHFEHELSYDVACNWKVYLENSMESYHSPILHRKHYADPSNPAPWTFEETKGPYEAMYSTGSVITFGNLPVIEGLSDKQRDGMFHIWVHPNLQIVATPTYMAYRHYLPRGPEKFQIVFNWCFPPAARDSSKFDEVANWYYAKSEAILQEDMEICPTVQEGLRSDLYTPGRFSPQEFIVHRIGRYVLERVLGDAASAPRAAE